jgi:hypothetical protein
VEAAYLAILVITFLAIAAVSVVVVLKLFAGQH